MYVQQFFVEGLASMSYLVGCESQGVAAVIDPDRDVYKYIEAAEGRGLRITHIVETHLHADYVSGNTDLAARTGARIYIHADAQASYPHEPLHEGDTLELGAVRLMVMHTPGHTPESITLLVSDTTRASAPWMALTGDTLFVGEIGRPDLVGAEAARALAAQMHHSLFDKLLTLDDSVLIYPGHGAGSLCGKSIGSVRATTLGFERKHNPSLASRDLASFVEFAVSELPEQPGNHQRIKAINRRGPRALGEITPRGLTIRESIPLLQHGAVLLDARPKADYVQAHVPGSIHLELNDQLSNRAGFVLPPDASIILLLARAEDYARAAMALARVGFDDVRGYLADSLEMWEAFGLPIASGDIRDIQAIELKALMESETGQRLVVVDVREPWEYAQGHVPGARLMPLGQLRARLSELNPEQPVAVICASGSRSLSAAQVLGQKGFKTIYNVARGMMDWSMSRLPVER
ncbi:MAG: MBL fold metallo-hydrolase [Anaerolineae bacterium]